MILFKICFKCKRLCIKNGIMKVELYKSYITSSMRKTLSIVFLAITLSYQMHAQVNEKIKVFFTHPVNTTVSTGINAQHLNNSMDDTLVAYINRAKYTLDIAVYNYQQSSGMADIANAVNNAQANGVVVRWIYDANQSNSGMSTLNSNIYTLGSPTTSGYGIMHNKFMIIDANSSNPEDALVWTGSTNWTKTHFTSNVNNSIVIQDKNLALAFQGEFNEMWGSSGVVPDLANSKFGPFKTNNTSHTFVVDGKMVELYFSPSDSTGSHVLSTIQSANSDLYFGMLSFSSTNYSNALVAEKNSGVYVAGIIDQTSSFYTPYNQLSTSLGSQFKVYSQFTSVYHNKVLITDACDVLSDPTVITGSYNWTDPAETTNDENILIIHDDTIANIFYQSFYQNFADLGGTIQGCVTTSFDEEELNSFEIYPSINNGNFTISWNQSIPGSIAIGIFDLYGREMVSHVNVNEQAGSYLYAVNNYSLSSGVYFVQIRKNNLLLTKKIIIQL